MYVRRGMHEAFVAMPGPYNVGKTHKMGHELNRAYMETCLAMPTVAG